MAGVLGVEPLGGHVWTGGRTVHNYQAQMHRVLCCTLFQAIYIKHAVKIKYFVNR
jgi:hypothetical protein